MTIQQWTMILLVVTIIAGVGQVAIGLATIALYRKR